MRLRLEETDGAIMDMLERVRRALAEKRGHLSEIAEKSGVSYKTLMRIRDGECDPGYSKVKALDAVIFSAGSDSSSISTGVL